MKLVLVEWVDSHSGRGWQDLEYIKTTDKPLFCRSVGWLVDENDKVMQLVPHVAGEKNGNIKILGCGDITIPKCAIKKKKILIDE